MIGAGGCRKAIGNCMEAFFAILFSLLFEFFVGLRSVEHRGINWKEDDAPRHLLLIRAHA